MDYFAEYMIRKHKSGADWLKSILYVVACLALTVLICFIGLHTGKTMVTVWVFVIAALWYFCYRLIRRQYIEYEYVFTNGELEVDAIYAKSIRRNLVNVRASMITFCARRDDDRYEKQYFNIPEHLYLIDATSNKPGAKVYYADFLFNAERTRLLFEPNAKIIEMMRKYNPKNIHIPDEE